MVLKHRNIAEQICRLKESLGEMMNEAFFSLAEAKFICGDFYSFVLCSASQACCTVRTSSDNVCGEHYNTW